MISMFASMFNAQYVELGWEPFDRSFRVKTNDRSNAIRILDRAVQEQLLNLKRFAQGHKPINVAGSGYCSCSVQGEAICMRFHGVLATKDQLWQFYVVAGQLFDLLEPRLRETRVFDD